jgi:hypothetical protein
MTRAIDEAKRSSRTRTALALDQVAPWLIEVGTWVFGGLMALNLVIIAALITVGRARPQVAPSPTGARR